MVLIVHLFPELGYSVKSKGIPLTTLAQFAKNTAQFISPFCLDLNADKCQV